MNPMTEALLFFIATIFDLATWLFSLRFLFQLHHVDFYNPYSQFLVKATNPLLVPIRKIIPGFYGMDCASLFLIAMLLAFKLILFYALVHHAIPHPVGFIVWLVGETLSSFMSIYFYALILQAILSWVSPSFSNPINVILYRLTAPILTPIRKRLPLIAGIDLSIIPAIMTLKLIEILIITPLIRMGQLQF